jgi:hypothetical protein
LKTKAKSIGYDFFLGGEKKRPRILDSALDCCIATAVLLLTYSPPEERAYGVHHHSSFIVWRYWGFENMTYIWVFLVTGLMKSERNKSKRKKRVDHWITITVWIGLVLSEYK